jgi:hypothetical protein
MKSIFLIFALCTTLFVKAQPYHAKSIVSGGNALPRVSTSIDKNNNTITAGFFTDKFFTDDSMISCYSTSPYYHGIYLSKYNTNDTLLFLKKVIEIYGYDFSQYYYNYLKVEFDKKGNIYLVYNFKDSINILGHKVYAKSGYDGLLLKLDGHGRYLWHRVVTGTNKQTFGTENFFINSKNEVMLTGSFGTGTNYSNDSAIFNNQVIANYSGDFFIVKYDENGNVIYLHSNNAFNHEVTGRGIIEDNSGNYYVYGYIEPYYQGSFQSFQLSIPSNANEVNYIIKYDSMNNPKFVRTLSTVGFGYSRNITQITVLTNKQILVYSRYYPGPTNLYYYFTTSYDSTGNLLWDKLISNGDSQYQPYSIDAVLADNNSNDYYLCVRIDKVYATANDTLFNNNTIIECIDSSGKAKWYKKIPCSSFEEIDKGLNQEIIISGLSCNTMKCDALKETLNGCASAFLLKLAPGPVNWNDTLTSATSIQTNTKISLFPNPTQNSALISSSIAIKKLSLFNLLGNQIQIETNMKSENEVELSTKSLCAGLYILRIEDKTGNIYSTKLIKE